MFGPLASPTQSSVRSSESDKMLKLDFPWESVKGLGSRDSEDAVGWAVCGVEGWAGGGRPRSRTTDVEGTQED